MNESDVNQEQKGKEERGRDRDRVRERDRERGQKGERMTIGRMKDEIMKRMKRNGNTLAPIQGLIVPNGLITSCNVIIHPA